MENNLGNKETMAKNIIRLMRNKGVNATDVCKTLGFPNATFSDWINAKTYPRIDKIEKMAMFFGVEKSDLVEEYIPAAPGSETREKLLRAFDQLDPAQQEMLAAYAETALSLRKAQDTH